METPTAREAAVLAVLERYCIPKEGHADAATHLAWLAGCFALNPDVYGDDAEGRRAMRDMLMRTCDPRVDGMWAWEIVAKIMEVLL